MREYRFVQVDVFTDRIFGGNPLAVVLDAVGITSDEMQRIAREMNLSETTFVLPPTRADCASRVRIFTPGRELPFAGHPTIGSAFVLKSEGLLDASIAAFNLEEGVGAVPITFDGDPAAPSLAWMRHGEARFGPEVADRTAVAAALGLTADDLVPTAPIQTGTTGLPFLFVPLRDRATVDRAWLTVSALPRQALGEAAGVFVLAADPDPTAARVYTRMFGADSVGIAEDPATGSASGPLGVYLVRNNLVAMQDEVRIISEQGTRMGRPSCIHIRLRGAGGEVQAIEVGGQAVAVLDGVLRLP